MQEKKWFTPEERPLKVGDFIVVETDDRNFTPRQVGIVISLTRLATIDGSSIPLVSVTKYKFVNFG